MAPPPYTRQTKIERAARENFTYNKEHKPDSQGGNVVASASMYLCTWLIIGGVAYRPEFNDSFLGVLVLTICLMIQFYGTTMALVLNREQLSQQGQDDVRCRHLRLQHHVCPFTDVEASVYLEPVSEGREEMEINQQGQVTIRAMQPGIENHVWGI